jgi:hypothetical protein
MQSLRLFVIANYYLTVNFLLVVPTAGLAAILHFEHPPQSNKSAINGLKYL